MPEFVPDAPSSSPFTRAYRDRSWDPDRKEWVRAPADRPYIEITPREQKPPLTFTPDKPDPLASDTTGITTGLTDYTRMNRAARERMSKGVEQLREGEKLAGGIETAFGLFDYLSAPIAAPLHTVVGRPLEQTTGIPHEYSEFAAGLAIPGYGLARAGGAKFGKEALDTAEKIFSPQTVSPKAGEAAASIRQQGGLAARDTETTRAAMEPFHRVVNALPEPERLSFMDYVEGRSTGAPLSNRSLQPLADTMREAFETRRAKLEALPDAAKMEFVEDYYPHFWRDPKAAQQVGRSWFGGGASRQGSGASLKARTVPTMADGIARDLVPLTTDPIEATMRYVASMDRFIASHEVLDIAKANGDVVYIKPKVMGASGHPESVKVPDGWVPIKGRGATRADGAQAYAPADWARVYNNYISRGVHANEDWGRVYDAARNTSNAITALELGLSGYHAFTMANEAVISQAAKGISQIVGGKPLKGVGSMVASFIEPVRGALAGKKLEQVYLGRSAGTPDMRRVVDLITEAGGRMAGKGYKTYTRGEYAFTGAGSYWTAFKRGALKMEMRDAYQQLKAAPISAGAKLTMQQIGRVMETVAQPLFEKYVPRLKNAAAYDTLSAWLEANPQASREQQLAMARKVWDSIDNRFGEMVQDNIFWTQTMKQASMLAMRSYSWNMGTVREIGGGALSALKDPRKLSIAHPDYDPRIAYVVAMPIIAGTLNATYQYLKTGKRPEGVDDLVAPRTGGEAPGFGGRGSVEERAMLPGYQKDVLGWYHDWKQEAANKIATGPRMLYEGVWTGKDWRGDPIVRPEATPPQWLVDYLGWAGNSLGPISARQLIRGEKEGSGISTPEMLSGIRPAPAQLQDPAGYERGMKSMQRRAYKLKQKHDRRTQQQYGGPQE